MKEPTPRHSMPAQRVIVVRVRTSHLLSYRLVAAFLQHPSVAVGISEIGETGVVSAARIQARTEAAAPATVGVLVPDLADGHLAICEFTPAGLEVGSDDVQS